MNGSADSGAATAPDAPAIETSVRGRGWGPVLDIVSEDRVRRRQSDIVRVVTAVVLVGLAAARAKDVTAIEASVFDVVASLPGGLEPVWRCLEALVPILAVLLLVAAVVRRRPRLLGTQVVAVAVAGLAAAALSAAVDVPAAFAAADVSLDGTTPDFPVVLLAAASASLWSCRPYVTRPIGRLLTAVIWLGALGSVGLVRGLPGAVLASLLLGWGAAALAHLCFGSPAATPSTDEVAGSLRDLGVEPARLAVAQDQSWGGTNYTAGPDDDLSIRVVGRDSSDAHLLAKLWRFVWYKDSGPTLTLTRAHQVEHQAYVLLLAGRTGARVPDLVAAGLAGERDDAVVAVRNPPGRRLSEVDTETATDAALDDAWANLALLHEARIAHGNPWVGNVVVDAAGDTGLVGLGDAVAAATEARLRFDRVQLLATTVPIVGEDRALAAAQRSLADDDLVELLAYIEPTALTAAAKRSLPDAKKLLTGLREAGAELTGVEPPEPTELHRFPLSAICLAAAFAVGVYLLVGQLAGVAAMGDIFSDAIWGWVVLAFVIAQLPPFPQSVAMMGAVSARLPFRAVAGIQFANAFTGLVGGTAGNATLTIRFFQKQGLPPAVAASSGVMTSVTGFVVQAVLIVTSILVTGSEFELSIGSDGEGVPGWVVAILAVLVVGGIVLLLVPSLRQRVRTTIETQVRAAWQNLRAVLSNPRKAVQLFGGNLVSQVFFSMVLGAALHAYGQSLPLLQLVLINSLASLVGGMAPVPGGMGVIETGLIAGFTASGIPEADAVAATFTARMCTSYLPPIWGWFALSWLRKHDYV